MTYLVDTNVISELSRREPDPGVLAWAGTVIRYAVSVISVDEVFFGLAWRPNAGVLAWMDGYFQRHEALPISPVILLEGGVIGADHHGQGAAGLAHRLPGGTEVQEDGPHPARVDACQVDVLGLDVTVQKVLGMNRPQAAQDRQHQLLGLVLRQASALTLQVLGERQPPVYRP